MLTAFSERPATLLAAIVGTVRLASLSASYSAHRINSSRRPSAGSPISRSAPRFSAERPANRLAADRRAAWGRILQLPALRLHLPQIGSASISFAALKEPSAVVRSTTFTPQPGQAQVSSTPSLVVEACMSPTRPESDCSPHSSAQSAQASNPCATELPPFVIARPVRTLTRQLPRKRRNSN